MKTKYAVVMVHNPQSGKYETGLLFMEGYPEHVFPILKTFPTFKEAIEMMRSERDPLGLYEKSTMNTLLEARDIFIADYIYVFDQKEDPGWHIAIIDECPGKHASDQEYKDLLTDMKNRGKYLIELTLDEVSPSSKEPISPAVYERKEKYLNSVKAAFEKIEYSMDYVLDQFPYIKTLSDISPECPQCDFYETIMSENGMLVHDLPRHLDMANKYTFTLEKTSMQKILNTHKLIRSVFKDFSGVDMHLSVGDKSVSELVEIEPNTKELITLPAGITSIAPGALVNCTNMTRILLPDTLSTLDMTETTLLERLKEAPALKEVGFPMNMERTQPEWSRKVIDTLTKNGYTIGYVSEKTYFMPTQLSQTQMKYLTKSRSEGYRGASLDRL